MAPSQTANTGDMRSPALASFIIALCEAISARTGRLGPASTTASSVFASLLAPGKSQAVDPKTLPACSYFADALGTAAVTAPHLTPLVGALERLGPSLRWTRRAGSEIDDPDFAEGHANAVVIGQTGLEVRQDVQIGISLMAPFVRYPNHRHPPAEVYLALSEGEWWRENEAWVEPGAGGLVYNRENVVHAMRSGPTPLLAVWCLWSEPSLRSANAP